MTLYALIHDTAGDRVASYGGMDQSTVTALITETGFTFDFIDAPTYAAFVLAHLPVPLTPAQILTMVHSQAAALAITGLDPTTTLQRAAALVIMDELNNLRQWITAFKAAVAGAGVTSIATLKTAVAGTPNTPDRNASQIQTAIQGKINAGTAD